MQSKFRKMQLTKLKTFEPLKGKKKDRRQQCKLVITYRKALDFNDISSMCGKRRNGKGTEESVRKKLVVQQREGFRLPSVFLAHPSLWCAGTHNLDKFMQNNWTGDPRNEVALIFYCLGALKHFKKISFWGFLSCFLNVYKLKKALAINWNIINYDTAQGSTVS